MGNSSLGAIASAGVVPELDTSAAGQTLYPEDNCHPRDTSLSRQLSARSCGCPAQQHPVCRNRLLPHADKGYKAWCKWEYRSGSWQQPGRPAAPRRLTEMHQMFQPHEEATCMSTCRNCVLPPAVLVSCKSAGKCWWFESYFPFPELVVPQVAQWIATINKSELGEMLFSTLPPALLVYTAALQSEKCHL